MSTQSSSKMGKAWVVFFIFFIAAVFIISGNNDKVAANMVLLMSDLGINATVTGLMVTVAAVLGGIAAIPIGAAMVKTGPRLIGLIAILMALAGCIIGALAPNSAILMIGRFFDGTAIGVIGVVVPSVVAALFPEEKRSLPMGIWTCWVSIGYIVVLFGTNLLADEAAPHTWVNVWWALSAVFVIIFLLVAFLGKMPNGANEVGDVSKEKVTIKDGFSSIPAILCGLIMLFLAVIVVIYSSFVPTYLNLSLGFDLAKANALTSLNSFGMMIGGILMGIALLKIKNKNMALLIFAILTGILSVFVFLFPANLAAVYLFLLGLISQCVMSTLFTVAPEAAPSPELVPITMSFLTFGQLMAGLTVTIAGAILDAKGFAALSYFVGVMGVLFIAVCATFVIYMKKRNDKKSIVEVKK